jgi:hypothetical protein
MPDLTIRKGLWDDFVEVAEKQHKKPETLVQQVLQEYIQRVSDEELLDRSASAARRAPFRMDTTEAVIRSYRQKKQA